MATVSAQPTNSSFSCSDVSLYMHVLGVHKGLDEDRFFLMNGATGISINSFKDKIPVRPLGYTNPAEIKRGVRTIAGTFSVLLDGDNPVQNLKVIEIEGNTIGNRNLHADNLPPFNIYGIGITEYGTYMQFKLIGVDITTIAFSSQLSDRILEETYEFICKDWHPMSTRDSAFLRGKLQEAKDKDEELAETFRNLSDFQYKATGGE